MVALAILAAIAAASTLVVAHPHHHGVESRSGSLPRRWYQPKDHPVYSLFRRQPAYHRRDPEPEVGSPEWAAQYPAQSPDPNHLPQEWVDALNDAIKDGKVPNYSPSKSINGAAPVYPAGINENRNNATICANTDRICRIPQDIWDGPPGVFGIGFDDGPTPASPRLYEFLQQKNVPSTHFVIGVNIRNYWRTFKQCYDMGGDITVHTYTHPMMTTQTNEQVLGELGYTMQIILGITDKLPIFWRPPSGDIDTRVSAIAREVFGLTAILWNQDTEDWTMQTNPPRTTLDDIHGNMEKWLIGSKAPGLIVLQHELSDNTVQAFIDAFPLIAQNGWKIESQARLNSSIGVYQDGKEEDKPFNSLIASPSPSPSPSPSAGPSPSASGLNGNRTSNGAAAASPSTSGSGLSTESHSSGSGATLVFPSLFTLGILVGSILTFM